MFGKVPGPLRPIGLFMLSAVVCAAANAGADDDYRDGSRNYARGDLMGAMAPLKRAADSGHAAAQALYALILDRADADDDAASYYRKSAEQGNADGQFGYGSMLASGEGTARDLGQARVWILRAAEQGHRLAINEMALAYLKGQLAIPAAERQGEQALRWIRLAADNAFVPAMDALADAYRNGAYGLAMDPAAAEEWTVRSRKARGLQGKRKGDRR